MVIGLLASIVAITIAFLTYRIFVFKSTGSWRAEYFKCYIVYGSVTIINVVGLWLLIDVLGASIWIAPLIITPICFLFSYFSHAKFTFKI